MSVDCLSCVVCIKHKTAYVVRISDWSSDVCSSDLFQPHLMTDTPILPIEDITSSCYLRMHVADRLGVLSNVTSILAESAISVDAMIQKEQIGRARVGKECVSTCRSGWSPYP